VAQGKPAPDIFLLAAAPLGVRPEECLGVEDAEAGVTAIKAAGMQALGVGDPKVLAAADRVVPGLDTFTFAELFAEWQQV
jgi:beta-phosphoglucomutase-like phosphatase (HAD superfamily)